MPYGKSFGFGVSNLLGGIVCCVDSCDPIGSDHIDSELYVQQLMKLPVQDKDKGSWVVMMGG